MFVVMICWCPMFDLIGWHQLSKKPLQIISCQELNIHSFQVTGWVGVDQPVLLWSGVKNGYPGPEIIHLHVNLCRPRSPRSPCYLSMWVSEAFSRTITESPGTTAELPVSVLPILQLPTPKWNIYYNLLKSFSKNVSKVNYGLSLPPDTCRGGSSIVEKQSTWLHHGKLLSSGNGFIGQNKGILCCYIVMDKFEGELGLPRKLSIITRDIAGY